MLVSDPLWYKDAIIYELHVRAFHDADGDGLGDFRGLTSRLDYLQDLGVTAVWLLPFYPSPLRDDGYDISDYKDVHDNYGTLKDFQTFLEEAHRRGLRVITELVLNHTSDQHPWFQLARKAPSGSPERDFYVWSDAPPLADGPGRFPEARVIFQDFERSNWAWDHLAKSYYWHRFYSHQPDLNYDNPEVVKAILGVVDFWLDMGVDGLRLDAAPYLFERDNTNCENLPETYGFLKLLRAHVDRHFQDRMLLAEANQWPEDAAAYFGDGSACHMAFHFPLMPRMFMSIHMEDRLPVLDILEQTPEIPEPSQWALFLRNHDELTLEMVTDEERDYMNRVYAQDAQARINLGIRRRLAPLMSNNRRRIELMNALLLSLPGTPVIYYGDEIGMGDNIYLGDRNGVRTPMQWSPGRNSGFSDANPQALYLPAVTDPEYHHEAVNVETQAANPHSLLSWMKRVLALRKRHRAFGRGSLTFLHPENEHVLAFLREYQGETILVVANLSRFVQPAALDLSTLEGMRLIELFGKIRFPEITSSPYPVTLGPHAFYWFLAAPSETTDDPGHGPHTATTPSLGLPADWTSLLGGPSRGALESALLGYLQRRSSQAETRPIRFLELADAIEVPSPDGPFAILLAEAHFYQGGSCWYQVPIARASGDLAGSVRQEHPEAILALDSEDPGGLFLDASAHPGFGPALLELLQHGQALPSPSGEVVSRPSRWLQDQARSRSAPGSGRLLDIRQSNTSIKLDESYIIKLFRRVGLGANPDLEVSRFLSSGPAPFPHVPPFGGSLEYHRGRTRGLALGMLQGYVPNQGTAWDEAVGQIGRFLEKGRVRETGREADVPHQGLTDLARTDPPASVLDLLGDYPSRVRRIGERTAELHLALARDPGHPDFAPEPFSSLYQRSVYQSMRGRCHRVLRDLRRRVDSLPEPVRPEARELAGRSDEVLSRFRPLLESRVSAQRLRIHGDYHLGQVLRAGDDYVIFDFEGDPDRPISERRLKRSPLRDVAGLLNSFHYAASVGLSGLEPATPPRAGQHPFRPKAVALHEPWGRFWTRWISSICLKQYLELASEGAFLPRDPADLARLLDAFLLEKALESLAHELDHRPLWAWIPIRSILQVLDE